ncbi:MAG: DoxX family membrane protein [Bacteroidota bacterium]
MKYLPMIARVLLALPMLIFGLNKLLPSPFLEMPPPAGEVAQMYMQGMFASYLAKLVALVEVSAAILLFVPRYERLALMMLFPVTLNIVLFHLFHDPAGTLPGLVTFFLNVILLLRAKALQKALD